MAEEQPKCKADDGHRSEGHEFRWPNPAPPTAHYLPDGRVVRCQMDASSEIATRTKANAAPTVLVSIRSANAAFKSLVIRLAAARLFSISPRVCQAPSDGLRRRTGGCEGARPSCRH